MTQPTPTPQFVFQVPDHLAGGVYSNVVGVWHTPYEFTLDFAVMLPTEMHDADDGSKVPIVPSRVVARVKIPPAAVFALMQALSTNERLYEENIGPIPRPGKPEEEPPLYPPEP